ncbi:hypothetical protein, partial [Methylomonas fluvii]
CGFSCLNLLCYEIPLEIRNFATKLWCSGNSLKLMCKKN